MWGCKNLWQWVRGYPWLGRTTLWRGLRLELRRNFNRPLMWVDWDIWPQVPLPIAKKWCNLLNLNWKLFKSDCFFFFFGFATFSFATTIIMALSTFNKWLDVRQPIVGRSSRNLGTQYWHNSDVAECELWKKNYEFTWKW